MVFPPSDYIKYVILPAQLNRTPASESEFLSLSHKRVWFANSTKTYHLQLTKIPKASCKNGPEAALKDDHLIETHSEAQALCPAHHCMAMRSDS